MKKKPNSPNTLRYSLLNSTSAYLYNSFITYTQFFYTDYLRVSASMIGRGWFVFGIWNTLNDPISGILSDKFRDRYKGRKKLITVLIIPVVIAYMLIWFPQPGTNENVLFIYFLVIISVFDLFHTIFSVNVVSLIPEIYKSLKTRTDLIAKTNALVLVFTGVVLIPASFIYTEYSWRLYGFIFALLALVLYRFAVGAINEKKTVVKNKGVKVLENLRTILNKMYFWNVLGIAFFSRLLLAIAMSLIPFYAKYTLGVDGIYAGLLIGVTMGAGLFALPFWKKITDKHGTRKTLFYSCFASIAASFLLLGEYSIPSVYIVFAVFGFFSIGTQVVPLVMSVELADIDYRVTKLKREGVLYGLMGSAFRFPPALSGLVLGEVLRLSGYNANLSYELNPDTVGEAIQLFFFFGSLVSLIIIVLFNYMHKEELVYDKSEKK